MRYSVVVMFEQGRQRGRTAVTSTAPVVGELRIDLRHASGRRSAVRVARLLVAGDADDELLPPLEVAEMVGMSAVAFTLSGVETVDGVSYAQTWLVRQAPPERERDPSNMHPASRRRAER